LRFKQSKKSVLIEFFHILVRSSQLISTVSHDPNKKEDFKDKVSAGDLIRVLNAYGEKPTKADVELMIWEVDDDLDKHVSKYEFEKMYKRCIADK